MLSDPKERSLQELESKYGPALTTPQSMGECGTVVSSHLWVWGQRGSEGPTNWIKLTEDCKVTVFFDNEAGTGMRERQREQRREKSSGNVAAVDWPIKASHPHPPNRFATPVRSTPVAALICSLAPIARRASSLPLPSAGSTVSFLMVSPFSAPATSSRRGSRL